MAMPTAPNAILRNLFAVALIVGIESVIAFPRINDAFKDYRLNSAASEVWQDMHTAKGMAIKEQRAMRVDFDHNSYTIVRVSTEEVALKRDLSHEYPEISIIVVTESRNGIVFDRTGAAESGFQEIEISGPTGSRRFTILPTGKISGLS